jgi:hypothetical protein
MSEDTATDEAKDKKMSADQDTPAPIVPRVFSGTRRLHPREVSPEPSKD